MSIEDIVTGGASLGIELDATEVEAGSTISGTLELVGGDETVHIDKLLVETSRARVIDTQHDMEISGKESLTHTVVDEDLEVGPDTTLSIDFELDAPEHATEDSYRYFVNARADIPRAVDARATVEFDLVKGNG